MLAPGSRVAVTGGAGFIGGHLVERLLTLGHEVVVVDDFSSGSLENLAAHRDDPRLRVAELDIRDEQALTEALRGARFVFHLACRNVRLSLRRPTEVHEVNATGTLNTLKAAAAVGAARYLYCSSSEVNGTADVVPMPEDYHFQPETIYGASKLTGEYYTQVFQRAGWLETVIARPHNNYGPREHYQGVKGEVIPRFILKALAGQPLTLYGDGAQTRDFTYVGETADFLCRLLFCDKAVGGTFNLCRGQEVSIARLAELILELTGSASAIKRLPGRPNDVLRLFGDPSRLRSVLGESPNVDIREGLKRTVQWFRENVRLTPEVLDSMADANWDGSAPEPWLAAREARQPS
jgi:UDP-glucose 4-epimerase